MSAESDHSTSKCISPPMCLQNQAIVLVSLSIRHRRPLVWHFAGLLCNESSALALCMSSTWLSQGPNQCIFDKGLFLVGDNNMWEWAEVEEAPSGVTTMEFQVSTLLAYVKRFGESRTTCINKYVYGMLVLVAVRWRWLVLWIVGMHILS